MNDLSQEVFIVVPARIGSARFPEKLLAHIDGKCVLRHTLEHMDQLTEYHRILAADHPRLLCEAEGLGYEVKLSHGNYRNGTERVAAAMREVSDGIIINVQADEWQLNSEAVRLLVNMMMADANILIASLCSKEVTRSKDENIVKVNLNEYQDAIGFYRKIPNDTNTYFKHVGVYGFRSSVLREISQLQPTRSEEKYSLEQLRWMDHGYKLKMLPIDYQGISINVAEDILNYVNIPADDKS